MLVYRCDRCQVVVQEGEVGTLVQHWGAGERALHLCSNCWRAFAAFMNNPNVPSTLGKT